MTAVTPRTVTETTTRHEFVMPNPTIRSEIYLALTWAEQKYEEVHGHKANWDDAFHLRGDDEEIVLWFETKKVH